ncbi:DMT family transporter [Solwaraspora sp. WMMD406]|uniref:DMT family transporter n=1 Tax=Solwaraspora sp. WMMD406 TaxID=3016095 RepID=UPI002415BF87|nr:DMT family transporter [Solwaraspora sp. WMMD406]MDG4766293.1 DMT family transporter [Solwaraspora sp. WMMD406]
MSDLLIAVAFAVASAGAYALAAVFQERLAVRLGAQAPWRRTLRALLGARRWWLAVALNGTGALLHVAALAYGPLSVVQPLGVLTLVLALPIGAALSARRVGARQWQGAALTIVGLALLLLLIVPSSGERLDGADGTILMLAGGGVVAVLTTGATLVRRAVPRSLLHATGSGVAFAVASALTHAVTREYDAAGLPALVTPLIPAIGVMAVAGVLLSQLAYRGSGLGAPLATVTLANPVASAVIGVALFDERFAAGPVAAALLVVAAATAGAGILLLVPGEKPMAPADPPAGSDAEPPLDPRSGSPRPEAEVASSADGVPGTGRSRASRTSALCRR